jgi:protease-3
LVPERLNVWYISQEEETNSELEFYVGPHAIEDLEARDIEEALALVNRLGLAQPSQNSLLPEAFDLKETPADVVLDCCRG